MSGDDAGALSSVQTQTIIDSPARWETRSANRVLEVSREQILERSRRLVDAAYDLLEQEGLDGLTIRAVLKQTKLSRRAFYDRFDGKDDLMLAVFEHTIRLAARHYREQVAQVADPLARLELIVTSIALGRSLEPAQKPSTGRRGAAMSREHMRLAQTRPEDLQAALSPLLELLAQLISDGIRAGSIRNADPVPLATLVYNLVSTTVHTELLAQEASRPAPARTAALATNLWDFCRRAIAA